MAGASADSQVQGNCGVMVTGVAPQPTTGILFSSQVLLWLGIPIGRENRLKIGTVRVRISPELPKLDEEKCLALIMLDKCALDYTLKRLRRYLV